MTDLPTPDIVDSPGKRFVGVMDSFDLSTRGEILALFDRFFAARDGIEGARPGAIYGLSLDARPDGSFRYAVAVEVDDPGAMPEGFCGLHAAPGAYAVFRCRTPMAEFTARFDAIFAEWLPAAPFRQREGAVVERYPDDDAPEAGKMLYEIWVPVTRD